tara:strand:- start:186 stop:515 length:330 start_codon:yes stop_codon:yes gene_type:complete
MIRLLLAAMTAFLFLILINIVQAHDGHKHSVMGVVVEQKDNKLKVKTKEGKVVTIVLTDKTKIFRVEYEGTKKLSFDDIVKDARVVVDVGNGKEPLTAQELKLGSTIQK